MPLFSSSVSSVVCCPERCMCWCVCVWGVCWEWVWCMCVLVWGMYLCFGVVVWVASDVPIVAVGFGNHLTVSDVSHQAKHWEKGRKRKGRCKTKDNKTEIMIWIDAESKLAVGNFCIFFALIGTTIVSTTRCLRDGRVAPRPTCAMLDWATPPPCSGAEWRGCVSVLDSAIVSSLFHFLSCWFSLHLDTETLRVWNRSLRSRIESSLAQTAEQEALIHMLVHGRWLRLGSARKIVVWFNVCGGGPRSVLDCCCV